MSYITRKMTIAINHHHHRCDTPMPRMPLNFIYIRLGFSFFTFFRRDNFSSCFASFFPAAFYQSIARSLIRSRARSNSNWLWVLYCGFSPLGSPLFSSRSVSHIPSFTRSICFGSLRPKIQSLKAKNKEKIISVNGMFFCLCCCCRYRCRWCSYCIGCMCIKLHYKINWWNYCGTECVQVYVCLKKPHTQYYTGNARTNTHTWSGGRYTLVRILTLLR